MNPYARSLWLPAFLSVLLIPTPFVQAEEYRYTSEDDIQVQTRGPVHEAFAEPVVLDPDSGIVISKAPPDAIDELPPDQQLDDPSAVWIPGYWGWDDDRGDFVWISGVWRIPPPGYTWMPGYWTRVADGYQWTAGFWTPVETREIEYLPPPPETIETSPSSPAPSVNHLWVPGVWYWQQTRYLWRPGYWVAARPNWVWVPAHYVWTPRGAVFAEGYWDYAVERRGILFAPVVIHRPVVRRTVVSYSPTVVIDTHALLDNLFFRPQYRHYYFGDYYAVEYTRRGILPWFQVTETRRVYDPIFVHKRWEYHRDNPHWADQVRVEYQRRVKHRDLRPVRTYTEQQTVIRRLPEPQRRTTIVIAKPLREYTQDKRVTFRFEPVKPDYRRQIIQQDDRVRTFTRDRSKWETVTPPPRVPTEKRETVTIKKPERVKIPSVIIRRPGESRTTIVTPPPRPTTPKVLIPPTQRPVTQPAQRPKIIIREKPKSDTRSNRKAG